VLDHYNTAALALNPPWLLLKWDEVVEYAFLSDFDLLRDARQEIRHRPWATPAGRLAMDTYFKLLRVHKESDRLNIKIQCVATHLRDKDYYLCKCEEKSRLTDPALAHQICVHCMLHSRFKVHHELCLKGIAKVREFSGTIAPGVSLDTGEGACVFTATNPCSSSIGVSDPPGSEDDASAATHAESERGPQEGGRQGGGGGGTKL
jgi:hypothetical protein